MTLLVENLSKELTDIHTYITSYTGQIQAVVVVHFQPFVLIKILLANLKISYSYNINIHQYGRN